MLSARKTVLAKIEAGYGVDAAPVAATDAVQVENVKLGFAGTRMHRRNPVKPSFGTLTDLYGGSLRTIGFDVEVKGSGVAGTAPELDVLLRACGMAVTTVPVTSNSYKPASSGHESATIWVYEDGLLHKLTGCRGTVSGKFDAGAAGMLSFNFTGHWSNPTDVALVAGTVDTTKPPVFIGAPFAVDAFAAKIAGMSFDLGLKIATPPDPTATDGYGEIRITGREVKGSFDPEATLQAGYDWLAKWKAANAALLTSGLIGATAGNRYQINFPKSSYAEIGDGDRDNILTREVSFQAAENVADDEFEIIFT